MRSDFVQQQNTICDFSTPDSWVILSPIEQSIKRKIEAVGTPLKDWDINIYRGVLTGCNEAFIINSEKRDEILANCQTDDERNRTAELIRPILRGRDIKRYIYDWADVWLINTHNGIKGRLERIHIEDYPAVKAHLDQFWDKIKDRADQGDTPYNLRNCAYLEINLNQIAVSKIQTFHSTFGEDNQVYSQEEILDRNLGKLFDEGMKVHKEDFNKEIPFYEELRTLYQTNRREYNRIAKLSLRSRTGREAKTVDGVTLSGDTLVFLKTNFRKVFFLVSKSAEEISVLDALNYFKALKDEQPVKRIDEHHQHVEMALNEFRIIKDEELQAQETSGEEQSSMGAQVSTAISLLTNFMREIDDSDLYLKVAQLKILAERGVITYIAKKLQRIQKDLRRTGGKARMTHDEALAEIIEMAKKYAPYYMAEESLLNETETDAEIILSESFQ